MQFLLKIESLLALITLIISFHEGIRAVKGAEPAEEPSLRIRLTDHCLNYTDGIGEALLNAEIRRTKIPDFSTPISSGVGSGVATARNIRIVAFRPLTYSYSLHPPNGLEWSTIGGSISIAGDWIAWYKVLFTVWFKGAFTATVSNIRLSATVSAIKDTDEKPAVKLLACDAKIGSVVVQITGGFIASIVNLFRSSIAASVKAEVESQVCKEARSVLINVLNQKLKSLPSEIDLGENFLLQYGLNSNPTVGTNYAEGLLDSKIIWKNRRTSEPIQCPKLPSPQMVAMNRMIYVWASDYILNTFFQSAHDHNVSRIDVDRHSFPEAAPYLRTTCPGEFCAGNISHDIASRYPNRYTLVDLSTGSAPKADLQPDAARLSAAIRADLFVEPKSDANLLIVFDIDFSGKLTVNVTNNNTRSSPRLTGQLVIDQFHVHINRSNVGYISPLIIDMVAELAKPFLQKLANDYLNEGVVVPTIPDVKLVNAQVTLMERAVQVEADFIYKNYTTIRHPFNIRRRWVQRRQRGRQ